MANPQTILTPTELVPPHAMLLFSSMKNYCETPELQDLVRRCGGDIVRVQFFDAALDVRICSSTPSLELWSLGYTPLQLPDMDEFPPEEAWDAEREAIDELLREYAVGDPEVDYTNRDSRMSRLIQNARKDGWDQTVPFVLDLGAPSKRQWRKKMREAGGDWQQAHDEWVEQWLEHLRGNPPY